MPTVFKYCDEHGVEILTKLEVKVTPPNQFNNPFEFMANIVCSNPGSWAYQQFTAENVDKLYEMAVLVGGWRGTIQQFRKQAREMRPQFVNWWIENRLTEALAITPKRILDDASDELGVLCLSKKPDSILMWGHYCDKNQGLVVGFDDTNITFKELRSVNYQAKRVISDIALPLSPQEEELLNQKVIFTKNEEWKYEDEMRQLFNLRSLRQRSLKDGKLGYFCPITPEAIVSVYLGTKCDSTLEGKVQKALAEPQLSHVKLARAVLHKSEFRLDFE